MLLGSAVDIVLSSVEERYELGDMIGVGHFSQVHCARPAGSLGEHSIALKGIEQSVLNDDEEALAMLVGECRALRLASECSALQSRVVRLREVLGTPSSVYLVLDRVAGVELFTLVERHGALPEPFVAPLMAQLCHALAALHSIGVVHCDVKPENLIISHYPASQHPLPGGEEGLAGGRRADREGREADGESSLPPQLTLIDFGYAATLAEGESCEGLAGSPEYAAPEVLTWLSRDRRGEPYGGPADVWSAAVTAHVLLTAELPFELPDAEDADEEALAEAARLTSLSFEQPEWALAEQARAWVAACMAPSQADRPTASEARALPWLQRHPGDVTESGGGEEGRLKPAPCTPPPVELNASIPDGCDEA